MKQLDVFWGLLWGASHRLMRRGKQIRRPLTASILILALVAQFGCASSGTDKRSALALLPPPPGEAALKVAVTSGRFAPEFDIVGAPWKGGVRGALKGALEGFFAPLQLVAFAPPAIIFLAPFMPVGLVAGLVEGAKAEPGVKIEEREIIARKMVASQRIQDDLRDRVVAIGRAQTPHTFTVLADQGSTAPNEQPDYRPLLQEGIQVVLEVAVGSVTLKNYVGDLGLVMTVKTRIVRTVDNAEIYANSLTYTDNGQTQTLLAGWVGQKGFQNELNRAYTDIAEKTVEEVFLRTESN